MEMRTVRDVGRTPKLLLGDVKDNILKYIQMGLSYEDSCSLAGITFKTFKNWRDRGEKQTSGIYVSFLQELKQAEVRAKAIHIQNIQQHAKGGYDIIKRKIKKDSAGNILEEEVITEKATGTWTASAWMLERRHPNEFGRNRETQVNDNTKPLPFMGEDTTTDIADPLANNEAI